MAKIFYVVASNNEIINGCINVSDVNDADIEKAILWDIEDTNEDWYNDHIAHLTELHIVKCNSNQGYKVLLNGVKTDSIGNVSLNYIDKDENNEVIRYSM